MHARQGLCSLSHPHYVQLSVHHKTEPALKRHPAVTQPDAISVRACNGPASYIKITVNHARTSQCHIARQEMIQGPYYDVWGQVISDPETDYLATGVNTGIRPTGPMHRCLRPGQLPDCLFQFPLHCTPHRLTLEPNELSAIVFHKRCQLLKLHLFNQFKLSHLGSIADTRPHAQQAHIATRTPRIPRCKFVKYLFRGFLLWQKRQRPASRSEISSLTQTDYTLGKALGLFRLRHGSDYLLMFDEFCHQITIQGQPVFSAPAQLSSSYSVSQFNFPFDLSGIG